MIKARRTARLICMGVFKSLSPDIAQWFCYAWSRLLPKGNDTAAEPRGDPSA